MKAKKEYVEKYCGVTPKDFEKLEDRYKKVLKIFSKYRFERILDVGCGDGNFSVLLKEASKAKEVYGIEISEKGVECAIRNGVKAFRLNIDTDDFPFDENWFDAVFAGEVIEHLFDPDHFLDEVYRTLKPEGNFVLSTPNLAAIHNRIALLFGYQPFPLGISARTNIGRIYEPDFGRQSLDHVRVFTLRSLKELLKIHKFEILHSKGSCAMLPENIRFSRFFKAVDKFFTLAPGLSYRIILECKKEKTAKN